MTTMLRLDPDRIPLWRDASTVQFGLDTDHAMRIEEAWQERLLAELRRGLPEAGAEVLGESLGVAPRRIRAFLHALLPVVDRLRDPALRVPRAVVALAQDDADDAVANALLPLLAADDALALVNWGDAVGRAHLDPPVAIVFATGALDVAACAPLLAADVEVLPIVSRPGGVDVGPVYTPGATSCPACWELYARAEDPAWPQLAMQVRGLAAGRTDARRATAAALAALDLLGGARDGVRLVVSEPVAGRYARIRRFAPHPACGCRAPQGTATAPWGRAPNPATTTPAPRSVPA